MNENSEQCTVYIELVSMQKGTKQHSNVNNLKCFWKTFNSRLYRIISISVWIVIINFYVEINTCTSSSLFSIQHSMEWLLNVCKLVLVNGMSVSLKMKTKWTNERFWWAHKNFWKHRTFQPQTIWILDSIFRAKDFFPPLKHLQFMWWMEHCIWVFFFWGYTKRKWG